MYGAHGAWEKREGDRGREGERERERTICQVLSLTRHLKEKTPLSVPSTVVVHRSLLGWSITTPWFQFREKESPRIYNSSLEWRLVSG